MRKGPGLLLALIVLTIFAPFLQAGPAYGLLRTFGSAARDNFMERAYDIEVDDYGIYIIGSTYSRWGQPQPSLTILEPDHSHRCSTFLEFVVDPNLVQGFSFSVEVNQTHVFVAGVHWINRYAAVAVHVATFSKTDCNLTGTYTFRLGSTGDAFALFPAMLLGEGIDLAVDDSGVYLLVGYFIVENLDFHVLKLDQYLSPVDQEFYNIIPDKPDLGLSIALGHESIYVAGLTNYDANRLRGERLFLLEIDKNNLGTIRNVTLVRPVDEFFTGLEVVVDTVNDIYLVTTLANNGIVVYKFDRNMNQLWTQSYVLTRPYVDPSFSPPEHIPVKFAYGVSAAVSSVYLFVGGFITSNFIFAGDEIYSGLFAAINSMDGEALFAFNIVPKEFQDPNQVPSVLVHGVDAFRDCVYLAGVSQYYRLEYVFLNNFNFTFSLLTDSGNPTPLGLKHERRYDRPDQYSWQPIFDQDTGASSYGFYGVFCVGSFIASTTSTTTVTETATIAQTTTSTTMITQTDTTTTTRTTTNTLQRTVTTTSTSVATALVTDTVYETQVVYTTNRVTREETVRTTIYSTAYQTLTDYTTVTNVVEMTRHGAALTETVLLVQNTTTTIYMDQTRTFITTATTTVKETDWISLPPVFYIPFFLLPIPLAAVVLSRKRVRIVINKAHPPPNWRTGDARVIDDIYFTPSVLNIKKNTTVTFVNEDEIPHVIVAYDGPAEYLFSSEEIQPGKKWKHKFVEPGVYHIASLNKPYAGAIIRVGR